jgi:hypothetical protein
MNTVELQIRVGAAWHVLNKRKVHAKDLANECSELTKMLADWENSRVFEGGTQMRVHVVDAFELGGGVPSAAPRLNEPVFSGAA